MNLTPADQALAASFAGQLELSPVRVYLVMGTDPETLRRVERRFDARSVREAVALAVEHGKLLHPIDVRPTPPAPDFNTRAADAHAVRLEMQSTLRWGQA